MVAVTLVNQCWIGPLGSVACFRRLSESWVTSGLLVRRP